MKRTIIGVLLLLIALGMAPARVRLDVKTHFLDKPETVGIKHGAMQFLERAGFRIVETGEDYCVWLERADEIKVGPERYQYSVLVALTPPSLFKRKASLVERQVTFTYDYEPKLLTSDDSFWKLMREKVHGIRERELVRAFHGGQAIAREVQAMIAGLSAGVQAEKR